MAAGALSRLARLAGVAASYEDAWFKRRRIDPETLRQVLAAMGFAVASDSQIADSLGELEAAEWRALLPQVVTAFSDDATIPIAVSADASSRIAWTIVLESGEAREGVASLDALERLGETPERRRLALRLPAPLPLGYHRLTVALGSGRGETVLIVAPRRCHLSALEGGRWWGLTTQLYGLRSRHNWGIGDFRDFAVLAEGVARHGARMLGVNPLHALFPAEPRHISPYSPSTRLFLNPLYIDVESVPDFAESPEAQAWRAASGTATLLAEARGSDLVDHVRVAQLKHAAFEALYRSFAERHLAEGEAASSARGAAFRRFQSEGGERLQSYALFTALHEHMVASGAGFSWQHWPAPLRDAASPEVTQIAGGLNRRIELHQYLQWEADRQLGAVARAGAKAGLSLGLYRDLAVGVDPNGAEAWADRRMMVVGASVGAPPDLLNLKGQDWGLAPVNPLMLRRDAYAPFIAALRANMRHAGLLRIDHVMALMRLYWVPRGAAPADGAYVAYPFADLRRILALESQRNRCCVIGEDLGTVPAGFRETMHDAGVLSYRLLLFERDGSGAFVLPEEYPRLTTASFSTHDIATVRGFWMGRDLDWRRDLDLYPTAERARTDRRERRRDRRLLLAALTAAGTLPAAAAERLLVDEDEPVYDRELTAAVYRFLGRSSARLVLLQIEDALAELEQANLPGTVHEHPNWRRKLSVAVDEILHDPLFLRLAGEIEKGRREGA